MDSQRVDLKTLRFWATRVDFGAPDECWHWKGAHVPRGYGMFKMDRKGPTIYAHRYAKEALHGETIADGFVIDHLCGVPSCVNPNHLEVVTQSVNLRRKLQYQDADGIWRCKKCDTPTRARRGYRSCLPCFAASERRRRALTSAAS